MDIQQTETGLVSSELRDFSSLRFDALKKWVKSLDDDIDFLGMQTDSLKLHIDIFTNSCNAITDYCKSNYLNIKDEATSCNCIMHPMELSKDHHSLINSCESINEQAKDLRMNIKSVIDGIFEQTNTSCIEQLRAMHSEVYEFHYGNEAISAEELSNLIMLCNQKLNRVDKVLDSCKDIKFKLGKGGGNAYNAYSLLVEILKNEMK